jgi:Sec-independent protein translocase protein TatA
MPDMYCLVLAGPRERLSWRLSLAPARNKHIWIWIWFIRTKLRAQKRGSFMFERLSQPMHLLVIFGIALLVFGPKKLPQRKKGSERRFAASREACPARTRNKRTRRASSRHRPQAQKDCRRLAHKLSTLFFCNSGINRLLAGSSSVRNQFAFLQPSAAAGQFANREPEDCRVTLSSIRVQVTTCTSGVFL